MIIISEGKINSQKLYRISLMVAGFFILLLSLLHGIQHWIFPVISSFSGMSQEFTTCVYLANAGIMLLLLFMALTSLTLASSASPLTKIFSESSACFY